MHFVTAALAAQHLDDLLREAEAERRSRLVRGARRSAWSAFSGRLTGLLRRVTGLGRRSSAIRPTDPRSATA